MKHLAIFLLVAAAVLIEVQGQIEPCLLWMKPQPTCPTNERYTCCKPCREATCLSKGLLAKCAGPCKGGCVCKNGYIRAINNGKCVLPLKCSSTFPFKV
ncbi:chymotrypsin inhibitor Ani s 6-like [Anopheles merus]|uniref:chymotrypsin inhibitor Ani s 6-like n=1 Tax=Anopheles merus TaxID=30066 RepID=UPI001BE423DF|nr:chymotrypsin inhibitor Ani s 6-like [Anopheles merus]